MKIKGIDGCLGRAAASFIVHLSAREVLRCDLRSLPAVRLPGIVGGMANPTAQLLCLFLSGVRPWDRGWLGTKSLCSL